MNIKIFPYNEITKADKRLLDGLFHSVWGSESTGEGIHPEEMNAMSFCAVERGEIIGYTGVVSWNIGIEGDGFVMCGLSCVCIRPDRRRQGTATALVREATEWAVQSGRFDVGLFTCTREHVRFYERLGLWEKCPNLILKESDRKGAYTSDALSLTVFRLLISAKAASHSRCFENTTLTLNFPAGQFV